MYDVDGKSPSTTLNDSKSKKFNLNHEIIQILHHLVITDERLFGIFQSLRLRWQQSGVDGEDPRARVTDQSWVLIFDSSVALIFLVQVQIPRVFETISKAPDLLTRT